MPLLRAFISELIGESSSTSVTIVLDNAKTPCLHLLSKRENSEEIDDYRSGDEHNDDEFHREAARWSAVRAASPEFPRKTCPFLAPKRQPSDRGLLLTPPQRKASDPDRENPARAGGYGIFPGFFSSPSRDIPDIDSFLDDTSQ